MNYFPKFVAVIKTPISGNISMGSKHKRVKTSGNDIMHVMSHKIHNCERKCNPNERRYKLSRITINSSNYQVGKICGMFH